MITDNHLIFLNLVRLGIGHQTSANYNIVDWQVIGRIAEQHGLSGLLVDSIDRIPDNKRPSKDVLLQWIGNTLHGYEYRYELYRRAIAELAAFYNSHDFKMMILKGYACSFNWPKPEHRPCGDIDIWLFGKQKEADASLSKEKNIKIDSSHHHHTVFCWRDFMVENHYDFVNVHARKSNKQLEKIFKELGKDYTYVVSVYGENVYIPSPNLHALFLLRHTIAHFSSTGITLRQVLDWAFFIEKYTTAIDWDWFIPIVKEYHFYDFFNCLNAMCVEDLGFAVSIFPSVQFSPGMKNRVLNDILCPEFSAEEPEALIPRAIYKYRRWRANEWKNELCFRESMWSAFWSGVWNHLLKPNSI